MAQSFRNYKKEMEKKRDRAKIEHEIRNSISALERKRDDYIDKAKENLRNGNKAMYNAYVALLKNAMFNISQSQDLLANFIIANDLLAMQELNRKALKEISNIMKDVYKTSKAINVKQSEKTFTKALEKRHFTALQLQDVLKNNQINFSSSVNELSDIQDSEIKELLEDGIKKDNTDVDDMLSKLEKEFAISEPVKEAVREGGPSLSSSYSPSVEPDAKPEVKPEKKEEPVEKEEVKPDLSKRCAYSGHYAFPPLSLLAEHNEDSEIHSKNEEDIKNVIEILEAKLKDFGIEVKTENYIIGSTFSRLELKLISTTPLSQIAKYEDDISMTLKRKVRLLLPIPGKDLIGVEVENKNRDAVVLRSMLTSDAAKDKSNVNIAIGVDIEYNSKFMKIDSLPHLLVAGTTGSGKSCFLHSIINSLIYRYSPKEVRLVLIDFKRVELGIYNGIPHLVDGKIKDEHDSAMQILQDLDAEMERRYGLFLEKGARNISEYNSACAEDEKLPVIITMIDEYADMVGSEYQKKVEQIIQRLAQKARAGGIHLIISTQRPTVKVINGVIKANFPTRVAFSVASHIDSQNILDETGAQNLVGKGDMLLGYYNKMERLQAPFISFEEIKSVVNYIKENN